MSCQSNNNMGAVNGLTCEAAAVLIANAKQEYVELVANEKLEYVNQVPTRQTQNVIDLTGLEEGCSQVSTQALPDLSGSGLNELQKAVLEVEAIKEQAKNCFTKADKVTLMEERGSPMKTEDRWMPDLTDEESEALVEDVDGLELTPIPPPMEPIEEDHLGNFRLNNNYVPQLFPQKQYGTLKRKFYTMGWEETELFEELLEESLAQREMLHHGYVPQNLSIDQEEFDLIQDEAAREAVLKVTAEYLSMEDLLDEVSSSNDI